MSVTKLSLVLELSIGLLIFFRMFKLVGAGTGAPVVGAEAVH